MGRLSRAFLLAGLIALVWCGAASAGVNQDAGPASSSSTDPQLVPAPAPVVPVPETVEGIDRGVHVSGLHNSRVPGPGRRTGTYTARVLIRTAIRRSPRGKVKWVARAYARWSGGTQWLMVLGSRTIKGEQWLKVRLPIRPNRSSGWLPRDRVALRHSPNYIVIDRSRRRLTIFGRKGRRKARFRVVIGKPSTPTPVGLFALYDRVRQSDRDGFVGPWVVPLTAHSDQLKRFDGGPGLVALHGRDGASFYDPLGSARSHGCVRMNNRRIRQIVNLGLGTAVRIRQ